MKEATTMTASSPDSITSLDLSQASTNSTQNDEESPKLVGEVRANGSNRSNFHYHTLFDIEEEDNISLSSGILSTCSLDLSFDQHSLASMETIKLQNSKEARPTDPEFESVEAEEIPSSRACHGALNITPRQLGEVFALFSSDKTPKQQWPPSPSLAQQKEETTRLSQSSMSPDSDLLLPTAHSTKTAQPQQQNDYPMSMDERATINVTNQRRLSSELFWKPRAKSLEKECASLREIIRVDSSNIVQLKAAMEKLEEDSASHLAEIQSLKEQLKTATYDLYLLKREREMLVEHETEHRETIRILKHEIDILTREDKSPCIEEAVDGTNATKRDQEELRQLRLENQLFASQIVEYEAELSCITLIEKEQEQLQGRLQSLQRRLSAHSHSSEESSPSEGKTNAVAKIEDGADMLPSREKGNEAGFSFCGPEERTSLDHLPIPAQFCVPNNDEGGAAKRSEERRKRLLKQLLDDETSDSEDVKCHRNEMKVEEFGNCDDFDSDTSSQKSMDVSKDYVLGTFTLNRTYEDGNEQEDDKVYVVQEQELSLGIAPTNETCLQWQNPNSLPSYVRMEDIATSPELEDRNPPVTRTFQSLSGISSIAALGEFHICDTSRRSLKENRSYEFRDGTDIEVLDTGEATEAIEVQLSPRQSFEDDNKENEGENTKYLCSDSCEDNCGAWSAVSDCLVFNSAKAQ